MAAQASNERSGFCIHCAVNTVDTLLAASLSTLSVDLVRSREIEIHVLKGDFHRMHVPQEGRA